MVLDGEIMGIFASWHTPPPFATGMVTVLLVLVVEDSADVRAYSVMSLTELGYRVLQAADAEAALSILRTDQRVDLVFTDVVLPGQSGRMLADESAIVRPGLKVLFTTGYSRNAVVHQGRVEEGVELLQKPVSQTELAAKVREVLDRPT